jgi:hypothetical protein
MVRYKSSRRNKNVVADGDLRSTTNQACKKSSLADLNLRALTLEGDGAYQLRVVT